MIRRLLLLLAVLAAPLAAQTSSTYNPRDDQYRLLGMTRAQAEYERAEQAYQRQLALQKQGLASASQVETARAAMENARVDYLQAALAIVFASPHVLIDRAVKSQRPDGRMYVKLTLRNEAQTTAEGIKLSAIIDSTLLKQLRPDQIPDVYVSLKDQAGSNGVIIGSPYEAWIPVLKFNDPVTLTFRLLKDVDAVTVSVSYANQSSERRVLLEKDASANIVSVQSSQFSQEADLGGSATYDLSLERFTSDAGAVRLAVGGLPPAIRYEFRDPSSGARLTQMRFPEGSTSQTLSLVLTLPARDAGDFALDKPITFWAFALDGRAAARFNEATADSLTAAEVTKIPAGKAKLELVPRGIAQIEVRAPNLYHEITRGDSVVMDVALRNSGSRVANSIRLTADAQPDWRTRVVPELIPEIPMDSEAHVTVTLVPPANVGVGDYDVRLETDALSAEQHVDVEDKTVRVHVTPPSNWLVTGLLVLALAGALVGMVIFGLKLTKR